MMLGIVALVLQLVAEALSNPIAATRAGAFLAGYPEFGDELVEICKRESPGHDCAVFVGIHPNNREEDVQAAYRKAISYKYLYLHPQCPLHQAETTQDVMRFGVRGSHGLMAAYSVRYLGPCVAPETLDHPLVSAYAATLRASSHCARSGECSVSERRTLWVGAALEDTRLRTGKKVHLGPAAPTSQSSTARRTRRVG